MHCIYKILLSSVSILVLLTACQPASNPDIRVGEPIPEFAIPSLDGPIVSSSTLLGSPVVLNFWATWCGPCVKEIPTLKTLAKDSGARVVTIAIDDNGAADVQPFVDKHNIGYTVLLGDKALFQRFNGWAIPYTLVLDSSLQVVSLHRGYVSLRTLERDLRRAAS